MIRYFAHHPTAANLLMLAVISLGVMSSTRLTRSLFPEFEVPVIQIVTPYPGASADEVELSICRRIEEQIEGIEGIKRVESLAREGIAVTTVSLTDNVTPSNVRSRVDEEIAKLTDLPDLAEETIVELLDLQLDVLNVAISGELAERDLLAYAEQLRTELLLLDDVSDIEIIGFTDRALRIEVWEDAMIAHGLSLGDIANAIRRQSLDMPGGDVTVGDREITVRMTDQARQIEKFEEVTVVSNTTGANIPLRSLAEVHDSFEDVWDYSTYNGRRAAHLRVGTKSKQDVLVVANRVKAYLAMNSSRFPESLGIGVWIDNSTILQGRWSMLVENITLGVFLVFLTLWFFLNGRLAFWVAIGIPISFLGTLWVIDFYGMPIDMISMIGLIVAVGLIVDDAIVISENVYAHRKRGARGLEAAVNGTSEVAAGVIASMVTTTAIFLPMLMLKGMHGKILNVIPFCVIIALAVSLVEAFLILPKHLSHSLPKQGTNPGGFRTRIDAFVDFVRDDVYGRVLDYSLGNRLVAFAAVAALSIAAAGLVIGGRLNFRPMPDMDAKWVIASIVMPEGTISERTKEVVQEVEAALDDVNEKFSPDEVAAESLIQHVATFYGSQPQGTRRGPHIAEVWIEMIDTEFRVARIDDVSRYWKDQVGDIADVEELTFKQPKLGPELPVIQIALLGDDLSVLSEAGRQLRGVLKEFSGVKNIQSDLLPGKEEVRIQLKRSAHALGVTSEMVANQLRAGLFGQHVQQFQRGDEIVDVSVVLHPDDRSSLADLEYFQILIPNGSHLSLYEVVDYEVVRGYSSISRLDGQSVVHITADVDPALGNAAMILSDLQKNTFDVLREDFPGISTRIRGETEEVAEMLNSAVEGAVIGMIGIFIVLSVTFRSYLEPAIVLLAIPLGIIGVIVGHYLLGMDLSTFSIIGLISLAGILVNDSIVMVEFIKLRLAEGIPPTDAFARAGRERFRAVVLTTATTTLGLMPMLLETSLQATVFKGLVVAIIFGELFSTAMILILIPCSYSLLNDFNLISQKSSTAH